MKFLNSSRDCGTAEALNDQRFKLSDVLVIAVGLGSGLLGQQKRASKSEHSCPSWFNLFKQMNLMIKLLLRFCNLKL